MNRYCIYYLKCKEDVKDGFFTIHYRKINQGIIKNTMTAMGFPMMIFNTDTFKRQIKTAPWIYTYEENLKELGTPGSSSHVP